MYSLFKMDDGLDAITREQFEAFRDVRRGRTNPERMDNPFWNAMVGCRWGAYWAAEHFGVETDVFQSRPVWCFSRIWMTRTMLPDGRTVFIGGEHEDGYDPHFAIYNDVIVRSWDGSIEIYGYPTSDFQPTDFHSATLVGDEIYVIGCVGYVRDIVVGITPVYRLDLEQMLISRIDVPGEEPGWINHHEALYWREERSILVWGGSIETSASKSQSNTEMWAFSLDEHRWRRVESVRFHETPEPWWFS
jgi:hypothetical protein